MSPIDRTDVVVRLPAGMVARAEALVDRAEGRPEVIATARVTKTAILRIALAEGLAVLEERWGAMKD